MMTPGEIRPLRESEHHTTEPATTWPAASGMQGVVAAGHPLVSMAGMRMLLSGGNALHAAGADPRRPTYALAW